jgi:hypothetical protein
MAKLLSTNNTTTNIAATLDPSVTTTVSQPQPQAPPALQAQQEPLLLLEQQQPNRQQQILEVKQQLHGVVQQAQQMHDKLTALKACINLADWYSSFPQLHTANEYHEFKYMFGNLLTTIKGVPSQPLPLLVRAKASYQRL